MSIDLSDTRREPSVWGTLRVRPHSPPDPFFPPVFAHSAEPSEDHNPRIQGPMSKTLADGVPNFIHPPCQATAEDWRWEHCAKVNKPA